MLEENRRIYRPFTEAQSLLVPVTIGCSHNACNFCTMYKDIQFRMLQLDEIENQLRMMQRYGAYANRAFLIDGNAFVVKADRLLQIFDLIRKYFPQVEEISTWSRADDVLRKTPEELKRLKEAGLVLVKVGVESGNEEVLKFQNKGVNAADSLRALQMLDEAGIPSSVNFLMGLGGRDMSTQHAIDSAKLFNQAHPESIFVSSMTLMPNTPTFTMAEHGEFQQLSPKEILAEERLFLANLDLPGTVFHGEHVSNAIKMVGELSEYKDLFLAKLDYVINNIDERQLRRNTPDTM